MNKKYLHHLWARYIRPVKVRYVLAAFAVSVGISAVMLRQNYARMVSLREAVYQADEEGGDVEGALQDLRGFVYTHMNTDLSAGSTIYPPLQLKYTYERLQKTEQERVQAANASIYTAAQAHCERLYPGSFSGGPRVPCIEQYVSSHGIKANPIPDALYKFDFASPKWSADLAGFSILLSLLAATALISRIALGVWLKQHTA